MTAAHTTRDTRLTCPACGWTTTPSTPGIAAFSLRRHSCTKHRTRQAAHARLLTRQAATDRTPKDCHHPLTHHQHGTRTAYVLDKCRCPPCAQAATDYERTRYRTAGYGLATSDLVDADPARDHVQTLREAGMGKRTIAQAAGINTTVVDKLLGAGSFTPSKRVHAKTARALLSVTHTPASGARVDATGTRRRLQALVAAGWPLTTLARELGMQRSNLSVLLHHQDGVTRQRADTVTALFARLFPTPPPEGATRARALATRRGWAVAAAWDNIDDPRETPNTGKPVNGWDLNELLFLLKAGETLANAARRVGTNVETAQTRLRRAGVLL